IRSGYAGARPKAAAVGREAKVFQSDYGLDYTHRQATAAGEDVLKKGGGGSAWKPKNPADIARNPALDLPGGDDAVNALFKDPDAALGTQGHVGLGGQGLPKVGQTLPQAQNHILERYFGWDTQKTADFWSMRQEVAAGTLTAADPRWPALQLMEKEWGKAAELPALVAGGAEEAFKKSGLGLGATTPSQAWRDIFANRPKIFADSPVGLAHSYALNEASSNLGAKGFANVITGAAKRGFREDAVSVADVLKDSGYNNENMVKVVVDRLKQSGIVGAKETEKALRDVYVPAAVAQDLVKFGTPFQKTKETRPLWKAIDTIGNLNKVSQTTLFPLTIPTTLRNALTELYTNLRQGASGAGESPLMNLLRPYIAQKELRSGGSAASLTKNPA